MTQSNSEVMRGGYEALARGDFDAIVQLLDPEIEMHDRPEAPDASTYRGAAGARTALDATFDYFDDVSMEPEEFYERDDTVVVVITLRGRGRVSGVPVEERLAHLWTLRDGRPYAMQAYTDPADALRAARIDPPDDA
jgi:ketosteroid isomerase-like protein